MPSATRADFLIIGAPETATSVLHDALSRHPQVHVASAATPADVGQLHGDEVPYLLADRATREQTDLVGTKLISVVRDPIDRAYSNWMHLWSDGLEPEPDFVRAFGLQDERVAAGWAPFWRYRELGLYGEQLEHLYQHVDPERVLVLRYRDVIDEPAATLDRACTFLGISTGAVGAVPPDNSRTYVEPGWRSELFGPVVRAGAWLGQYAPPEIWRRASVPLVGLLSGGRDAHRPHLTPEQRGALLPAFADDVVRLCALTGQDFSDWLGTESRGSFAQRTAAAQASEVTRS